MLTREKKERNKFLTLQLSFVIKTYLIPMKLKMKKTKIMKIFRNSKKNNFIPNKIFQLKLLLF